MLSDDKTAEKVKLRLADASAVPSPPTSIGNNDGNNPKNRDNSSTTAPGAVAINNVSSPRERTRGSEDKFSNLIRSRQLAPSDDALEGGEKGENGNGSALGAVTIPGKTSSRGKESRRNAPSLSETDGPSTVSRDRVRRNNENKGTRENNVPHDDNEGGSETHPPEKLVEAQLAKDVDVEALVNERIQQMVVGVATAEVQRDGDDKDEEDDEEEEANTGKRRTICIIAAIVGLLIVTGAVVGTVALQNRATESNDTAPTIPLVYTPPSSQDCEDISLGLALEGQESLLVERLDVEVDVSLDNTANITDIATLLPSLEDAMQERLVPALSHCPYNGRRSLASDNPKYVVANTFLQLQDRPGVSCSATSPQPCHRIVMKLELYLKGDEYVSTLMNLIYEVQSERPLVETLGLSTPFTNISIMAMTSVNP